MIWLIFSIGSINAFIPVVIIIILIGAAAGLTRGFDLLQILGFSAVSGYARQGSKQGIVGAQRTFVSSSTIGASIARLGGSVMGARPSRISRNFFNRFGGTGKPPVRNTAGGSRASLLTAPLTNSTRAKLKAAGLSNTLINKLASAGASTADIKLILLAGGMSAVAARTAAAAVMSRLAKPVSPPPTASTSQGSAGGKAGPKLVNLAVKAGKATGKGLLVGAKAVTGYYGGPLHAFEANKLVKEKMFELARERYGLSNPSQGSASAASHSSTIGKAASGAFATAQIMQEAYRKAAKVREKSAAKLLAKHIQNESIKAAKFTIPKNLDEKLFTAEDVNNAKAILNKTNKDTDEYYKRYKLPDLEAKREKAEKGAKIMGLQVKGNYTGSFASNTAEHVIAGLVDYGDARTRRAAIKESAAGGPKFQLFSPGLGAGLGQISEDRINTFLNGLKKTSPEEYKRLKADAKAASEREISYAFTAPSSQQFHETFDRQVRSIIPKSSSASGKDPATEEDMIIRLQKKIYEKEKEDPLFMVRKNSETENEYNDRIKQFNSSLEEDARKELEAQLAHDANFKKRYEGIMERNFPDLHDDPKAKEDAFVGHVLNYSVWREEFMPENLAKAFGRNKTGRDLHVETIKGVKRANDMIDPALSPLGPRLANLNRSMQDYARKKRRQRLESHDPNEPPDED